MMRPSTFFFLTRRGVRNLGKHWAMTIACIASLSVCMTLNIFASLAEVNVGSMVAYLGSQVTVSLNLKTSLLWAIGLLPMITPAR